jgi:ferredoxin
MILPQDIFDALPDPDEEEEDMLDLALGLQDTSRLGCQVVMTEAMDGARIVVPFDDFG